eukprot:4130062-Ditylum_brightwellii.AAC.1
MSVQEIESTGGNKSECMQEGHNTEKIHELEEKIKMIQAQVVLLEEVERMIGTLAHSGKSE